MVPFPLACLMRGGKDFKTESQPSSSKKWEASSLPQPPTSTAHRSGFVPSINHILSRNLKGGSAGGRKGDVTFPSLMAACFPTPLASGFLSVLRVSVFKAQLHSHQRTEAEGLQGEKEASTPMPQSQDRPRTEVPGTRALFHTLLAQR